MVEFKHVCPNCGQLCVVEVFNKSFAKFAGRHPLRCLRCYNLNWVSYSKFNVVATAPFEKVQKETLIRYGVEKVSVMLTRFGPLGARKARVSRLPFTDSSSFRFKFQRLLETLDDRLIEVPWAQSVDLVPYGFWKEFTRLD